ncbi:putative 26S proteasome regulatory subunit [Phlyctochytrium planicorne]|nr:putative 26S proteasome regulatory subunit [Phlyctochytrium planicorne]
MGTEFQATLKLKENIEVEIKALEDAILSHKIGLDEPLVTPDGFPRNDVDVSAYLTAQSLPCLLNVIKVWTIRHLRHELVLKKNDYKDIMKQMEKVVQDAFQKGTLDPSTVTVPVPFAFVNSVAEGSPAAAAGLRPGDKILR